MDSNECVCVVNPLVMWGSRKRPRLGGFVDEISVLIKAKNGYELRNKLQQCLKAAGEGISQKDISGVTEDQLAQYTRSKFGGHEFIADFFRFAQQSTSSVLEPLTNCMRAVTSAYIAEEGIWLFPFFVFISSLSKKVAFSMDEEICSNRWKKKMVEIFRELFPLLYKERDRLPGTCFLISQLLQLYMALDQVKLCAHILAALTQTLSKEGGFRPQTVPKFVAVSLYFNWGKFLLLENKYHEAYEKLVWAFTAHRHSKIAEYLIPAMIAIGSLPKEELFMQNASRLNHLMEIAKAIKQGNIQAFNNAVTDHRLTLAKSGTLILIEKCKLLCYRNLVKRTANVIKKSSIAGDDSSKLDLPILEDVWKFAANSDKDEMICTLADLIYTGAMKGYIAVEHNKLVLSKVNPFPPLPEIM